MKKKNGIVVLLVLILCCICFIWGNSLVPGEESGDISRGVLHWLVEHFPFLNWMPELLLRKLGHFCEFGGTALLLAWLFLLMGERGIHRFTTPLVCTMLIALADETIQRYTPGRGSTVVDVWIDTLGACTGITVLLVGYAVWRAVKK